MFEYKKGENMETITKKVSELIPYINNPRNNDDAIDAVASSIKNFGFKVPIVVDSNNEIINGHTRLKAAKKLGLETVLVIVADDLTPEQIKAFRLADNKVGEIATWDENALAIELEELKNLDFDMSEFEFEINEPQTQEKNENTDSVLYDEKMIIIIESDDESKLEEYFDKLVEEGYPCRISTL